MKIKGPTPLILREVGPFALPVLQMKIKKIYQGVDTAFGGGNLYILLKTNLKDLSGFTAEFKVGGVVKRFEDLSSGKLSFNLTAEETASLPLGVLPVEFVCTDGQGRKFKGLADTLFEIKTLQQEGVEENV